MLVALAVIVEVVAMRMQDMEVGLRTGKGDVEQSPLLFDFGVRFGGQVGRDVAAARCSGLRWDKSESRAA